MEFRLGTVGDVVVRCLPRHEDERGWLAELFRSDELPSDLRPEMAYLSESRPGIRRGPHEHREQTDVFVFLGTAPFRLYLWDARPNSASFRVFQQLDLPASQLMLAIVPPGVVHAYRNVGASPGWVLNFPNRLYRGPCRRFEVDEIRHEEDPASPYRIGDD